MCCIHMTGCETIFSMLLLENWSSTSVMGIISPWVKLLMCLCAVCMCLSLCACLYLFICLFVFVSVHMVVCVSVCSYVCIC